MEIGRKNYNLISVLKLAAAFLVVAIHTHPLAVAGELADSIFINTVCAQAVPFFFACSGFFFFRNMEFSSGKIIKCENNHRRLFKYLKRIVILYVLWSVVYIIYQAVSYIADGTFVIKNLIWLIINVFLHGSYGHLWYIVCLIYAIVILYLLLRIVSVKFLPVISALLWVVYMITSEYCAVFENVFPIFSTVSSVVQMLDCVWMAIFRALPLISLGVFVCKLPVLKKRTNLIAFILSFVILNAEIYLKSHIAPSDTYVCLFSTAACAYFLFAFIVQCDENRESENNRLCYTLQQSSTIVYCLHMLPVALLTGVFSQGPILFLVVASVSFAASIIIVTASRRKNLNFLRYLY